MKTNEVIDFLNRSRKENKVKINDIAKNMYYHRNTISKVLNYRRKNVSMDLLLDIAEQIGCDLLVEVNNVD